MKIEGLVQKTQNGLFGALGPPGGPSPGAPIGEKRKTWLDNYLKYLHANFEINQSSPSTQKSQAIRNADPPCFQGPGGPTGGPIEKCKRSFVHHGLLKRPYKFHQDRIKIVRLHSFGAKGPKMAFFGVIRSPRALGPPGGPIKKPKRSFVHHGLLKSSYKFHSNRIKIVGLHSFGAKGPKMAFFGVIRSPRALGPPGWSDRKTQT